MNVVNSPAIAPKPAPEPAPALDAARLRTLIDIITNTAFHWGFQSARIMDTSNKVIPDSPYAHLADEEFIKCTHARIELKKLLGIEENQR